MYACVRARVCACVSSCVCVCVCVCERERERVCVGGLVGVCVHIFSAGRYFCLVALYQSRLKGLTELVTRLKPPA